MVLDLNIGSFIFSSCIPYAVLEEIYDMKATMDFEIYVTFIDILPVVYVYKSFESN